MIDFFFEPLQYSFLKKSLVSCVCLSLSSTPVGVLLILRRMSLMGDALSHSLLPGAAIGYILAGVSLPALGIGGFVAGLVVALLSAAVTRHTQLKEDASFAGFFLISLALGVFLVSLKRSSVDLIHILFGSALSVDAQALYMMGTIATLTLFILAVFIRPFLIELFDPHFFRSGGGHKGRYHNLLLILVVMNLVSGFQSLGTLLSLGMMMIPAITARFWSKTIWGMFGVSIVIALLSGAIGLFLSYHQDWPSGPSIVLVAGGFYLISLVIGSEGSVLHRIGGH